MNDQKITLKFIASTIIVVFLTFFIHEFAHWLTSEYLGYETIMGLNWVSHVLGQHSTDLHNIITSVAGPVITIIQGLLAFVFLKFRQWNKYVYAFLFTALFMRSLAGIMNFIMLNDEGRISEYLKLGTFTLPLIVSGILFYMVFKTTAKYKLKWKFLLSLSLLLTITVTAVIFFDQYFKLRIL